MSEQRDANQGLFLDASVEDSAGLQAMQTILPGQFAPFGGNPASPSKSGSLAPVPNLVADDTPQFRPSQRPAMALLCVLHDGDAGGEWIPLRAERYTIARNEGDIRIPHDGQISGRQHVEISRTRTESGSIRWQIADLGSTNGTFVRVSKLTLWPSTEVQFGQTRYRFDMPEPPAPPSASAPLLQVGEMTVRPGPSPLRAPIQAARPTLVQVTQTGDGTRIPLARDEYWLGLDPNECAIVPRDDPFISPRHARIFKGENGRWRVENNSSRNGVWLRIIQPLPVEGMCQFLLGEQRCILKVLT